MFHRWHRPRRYYCFSLLVEAVAFAVKMFFMARTTNNTGRPRKRPPSFYVGTRIPFAMLERIDNFNQREFCGTRSDAIRQLLESALEKQRED